MADEKEQTAPAKDDQAVINIAPMKNVQYDNLWWGILVVYLLLFLSTGFIAFFERDINPALDITSDNLAANLTDEATKSFVMETLRTEAAEHKKRADLASQSFNVVLGALLGFLSASAVTRVSAWKDGASPGQ